MDHCQPSLWLTCQLVITVRIILVGWHVSSGYQLPTIKFLYVPRNVTAVAMAPPHGAWRRWRFSPELPRATRSQPNLGRFCIYPIFFEISTCGSRKSTISPPATDVVYDVLLRCVAGGHLRPPAAAADQKNIKKSQKKGTQNG